ncbi:MBL fold metallo-hydrolase [Microbacterium sp. EST19A]|uniref:MBL fold metallo-hydrolase n=1 Tax=Microbacterium sp. EST19A TaxID=2862681 RepID=UPI001CC15459|nr:MBL fold metallo-hydrolase [Microbacterium sp. EST19A]
MTSSLAVIRPWFRKRECADGIVRVDEPHVHEFLRANIWLIRGETRNLVVDTGLGVAALREEVPELFAGDPVLVVTHAHLDHMGSAHEFDVILAHPAERTDSPVGDTVVGPLLASQLGLSLGDEAMPEVLLTARPHPDFDPLVHRLRPTPATGDLLDGETIDLGDRILTALHLPGHTSGSLALYEAKTGALFSGDVIYDDVLLDDLHGSDRGAYANSLERLRALPIQTVYPGHGDPFSGERMREIIDAQLREWAAMRAPGR